MCFKLNDLKKYLKSKILSHRVKKMVKKKLIKTSVNLCKIFAPGSIELKAIGKGSN